MMSSRRCTAGSMLRSERKRSMIRYLKWRTHLWLNACEGKFDPFSYIFLFSLFAVRNVTFDRRLTCLSFSFCFALHNSYYGCGVFVGKLFCIMIALDYLFWVYLEWILPRDEIEIAPKFPYKKFKKVNLHEECVCWKVLLEKNVSKKTMLPCLSLSASFG